MSERYAIEFEPNDVEGLPRLIGPLRTARVADKYARRIVDHLVAVGKADPGYLSWDVVPIHAPASATCIECDKPLAGDSLLAGLVQCQPCSRGLGPDFLANLNADLHDEPASQPRIGESRRRTVSDADRIALEAIARPVVRLDAMTVSMAEQAHQSELRARSARLAVERGHVNKYGGAR